MKPLYATLAALLLLAALIVPSARLEAAPPVPVLAEEGVLTGNGNHKLPSLATGNGRVYITWAIDNNVYEVDREEESGVFGQESLGSNNGNPTYFNSAVAVGADGTEHVAWISGGSIVYRRNVPGQGWSGVRAIAGAAGFPNNIDIATQGSDRVFVIWRDTTPYDGALFYVFSLDGGASWSPRIQINLPEGSYSGIPHIAADPDGGPVMMTYTGKENGIVYAGEWNGQNFNIVCVSCVRFGGKSDFFNPSITVTRAGTPYVIWRAIGGGIFFAERQPNGSWGVARISGHLAPNYTYSVAIAADVVNNVHMAWIARETDSEPPRVWYVVRNRNGEFSSPIAVSRDGDAFKSGIDLAVSATPDKTIAHIAWESFRNGQYIRYARVHTGGIGCAVGQQATQAAAPREIATPEVAPQAELDAMIQQVSPAPSGTRLYLPLVINQKATC
ncbi:MAG: hypothetical protein KatS3mg063_2687 [Tepidiforma sp.]|uniref:hypothetical protein n=1 Tax=Tepidiforma sp. TaxID=2682230 RepID=UPI0021DDB20B|nr:hypothetical protein [Tepidiforma sp.]GIV93852.1 MAG: hypothetical protein KatS3mg056_2561 [Chloroflexus sp.]GIW16834.1 MAG: hypothetical protein KatS3mg063_2687 [Tepidiforma sp.]